MVTKEYSLKNTKNAGDGVRTHEPTKGLDSSVVGYDQHVRHRRSSALKYS